MAKIYLGVGHGGRDPGACANGFQEKALNLDIALACREELQRHGVEVKISRTVDCDFPLKQRIADANAFAPDYALDIHNNAGGGDGAEVYHHFRGGAGRVLADNLLAALQAAGQNLRGPKVRLNDRGTDYFGFIRQIACPSVIVECAYMDTRDIEFVNTLAKRRRVGVAIAHGVLTTLGIPIRPAKGDADGDGQITAADALQTLQHSVKLRELSPAARAAADVNGDGQVNAADALAMLQQSVGLRKEAD